ncbi:hypothetical protein Glove_13g237 [Diversispora epigaea]|uniref:Uncharacterized protein n=1 Tax=Diversispora epigaea TaxID=1348612 RepID=A0A397JU78_9GLOM|nr:hypothetical protein Glove_13g234 [Diversispora epigaea]RHZ89606.1 hypothetical protein Glove_13g237 [Diversispora epigaea]
MLAANKFELDELTNKLETHLIDIKASCIQVLFLKTRISPLPESALVSLPKRDDLQMKEVKALIMSSNGISQNPIFSTNLEEWSKKNFLTLKTTPQKYSLISYFKH